MKTPIASALVAALLIPGMAHADTAHHEQAEHREAMHKDRQQLHRVAYRNFKAGERFERSEDADYRVLAYRHYPLLNAPPPGYVWIRSGDNALLVRRSDDFVAHVVRGIF